MNSLYNILLSITITIILFMSGDTIYASDPPEPPGGGHGQGGDITPGGSAPLGGGTLVLITLSSLYGIKKVYDLKNKKPMEKCANYIKSSLKTFTFLVILTTGLILSISANAQVPDPPGGHGSNDDNPPGGGAPIGSGVFILLGLGVAYGGKKLYKLRRNDLDL